MKSDICARLIPEVQGSMRYILDALWLEIKLIYTMPMTKVGMQISPARITRYRI